LRAESILHRLPDLRAELAMYVHGRKMQPALLIKFAQRLLPAIWAAAGLEDTLLRWNPKPEMGHGNATRVQQGVQA
jgi:hypothetical protein